MNHSTNRPIRNALFLCLIASLVLVLTFGTGQMARAAAGPAPVNLGTAASFVILTKTGITNVPTSAITGNMGVSPIASTAITGFSLVLDSTGTFSTSSQVTGKIYAANYTSPTPSNMTTAISNMQTAYTDAAGRALPDYTELYGGDLSGKTLVPGLYKWSTNVLINTDVTLAGPANAVWIFQIAGNITMGSGARMVLSGGAQAANIFWQVGGGVGVEIGTTAHVEGTVLAAKAIHMRTGSSMNGRALAQTAVTLDQNTMVIPTSISNPTVTPTITRTPTATRTPVPVIITKVFTSVGALDGWVLESSANSNVGGKVNSTAATFALGDNAQNKQFRAILHFNTSSLPDTAVVTKVSLKIMKQGQVGKNPFRVLGVLCADVGNPYFGTSTGLQLADFQAVASSSSVAMFGGIPVGSWYGARLSSTGNTFVNLTGTTQFRLRFMLDDNNNHSADYMSFYSGDAHTLADRPQLVVQYYVP